MVHKFRNVNELIYFCSKFSPFSVVTYTAVREICFQHVVSCTIVTAVDCDLL